MLEPICYKKPFLREVIVRVDFATALERLEKGTPVKLLTAIVSSFPIVEPPADLAVHEVHISDASVDRKTRALKQRKFCSKDRTRELTLTGESFFIQFKRYSSYAETREQFETITAALCVEFPDAVASRFGLRYINQISIDLPDPTRWSDYIDARLLASRNFIDAADELTRIITINELKYGDLGLRFQYGMPNPDHPAPIKQPLFVLDLDASVNQAHSLNDTLAYRDEGHTRIQNLFERSITQTLREKMDVRPVQE